MKRFVIIIFATLLCATGMTAQKQHHFNPAQFQADLEQFITSEAGLTPKESAAFFPVYREMREKQLAFFGQDRRLRHVDANDDKACAEAIALRDDNDIKMKQLQKIYHQRFMKILPASKVFRIIRAEDKFHRQLFSGKRKLGEHKK